MCARYVQRVDLWLRNFANCQGRKDEDEDEEDEDEEDEDEDEPKEDPTLAEQNKIWRRLEIGSNM